MIIHFGWGKIIYVLRVL